MGPLSGTTRSRRSLSRYAGQGFLYQNYSKGLAQALRREVENLNHPLHLVNELAQLLDGIRTDTSIDDQALADSFVALYDASVANILQNHGFLREGRPSVKKAIFATERANRLYLEFALAYHCKDATNLERKDALLEVQGDGIYDTATTTFLDMRNHGEKLTYIDADGPQQHRNVMMFAGPITLGHKTVHHTVRLALDPEETDPHGR